MTIAAFLVSLFLIAALLVCVMIALDYSKDRKKDDK